MFLFKKKKDINYAQNIIMADTDMFIDTLTETNSIKIPGNNIDLIQEVMLFDLYFHAIGSTTLFQDCKLDKLTTIQIVQGIMDFSKDNQSLSLYYSMQLNFYMELGFAEAFEQFTSRLMRLDKFSETTGFGVYAKNSDLKKKYNYSQFNDNIAMRLASFYVHAVDAKLYKLNIDADSFLTWMPNNNDFVFVTPTPDFEKFHAALAFEMKVFLYNVYKQGFLKHEEHKNLIVAELIFYFLYLHHKGLTSLLEDCHIENSSIEDLIIEMTPYELKPQDLEDFSKQTRLYETLTPGEAFKQFWTRLYFFDHNDYKTYGELAKSPSSLDSEYNNFVSRIGDTIIGTLNKQQKDKTLKIYLNFASLTEGML